MIMVAIVIVIIPVAIRVPPASFHIPPPVPMFPAIAARFREFMPGTCRLFALPSMFFRGLVQAMIRFNDSFLAIIRLGAWRCSKQRQSSRQKCRPYDPLPARQILSMSHNSFPPGNLHARKRLRSQSAGSQYPLNPSWTEELR